MSLKRSSPRSIATQLVLLFTPAAACLLYLGLTVFYWFVVRHATEEDNNFLADNIQLLQADLVHSSDPASFGRELGIARTGAHSTYLVRVLDRSGAVVTETAGMRELLPVAKFAPANASKFVSYRAGGRQFALGSSQFANSPYLLQVAQDRSEDDEFARNFGWLLAIVLPVGVLAAAAIAITVTRRCLQPLAEMARSLRRTEPSHLNERIDPARWPRELQPVAIAFDDMLARLEDSFRRLSQFSADLAHELRTPVANLLGEAQVSLTRARAPEEYRAVIESSIGEYERLSGIIANLLFLARADAAESQLQRASFNGAEKIAKVASFYEMVADEQQVKFECRGAGTIYADPMLFERALSNLIENALRFTPATGMVHLSLDTYPDRSEIKVTDSGAGISAEHLPKIFDRFYRVEPSRAARGAGLGLALVKSIAELHGGSATIESKVGQGTTVKLTFPAAEVSPKDFAIDSTISDSIGEPAAIK